MVKDTEGLLAGFPAPNVEVFCSHGSKVDTTETVIYPKGSYPSKGKVQKLSSQWPWPSEPSLIKGDGDGTVNIRSLQGCLKWRTKQTQPVHHHVFEKVNHLDMLRTEEPTQNVANIIQKLNMELKAQLENIGQNIQDSVDSQPAVDALKDASDEVHPIIEVV